MDKTLYPWPAVLVVSSEYCILDTRVTVDVNQLLFDMILCHFFKIRPRVKFQLFLNFFVDLHFMPMVLATCSIILCFTFAILVFNRAMLIYGIYVQDGCKGNQS